MWVDGCAVSGGESELQWEGRGVTREENVGGVTREENVETSDAECGKSFVGAATREKGKKEAGTAYWNVKPSWIE